MPLLHVKIILFYMVTHGFLVCNNYQQDIIVSDDSRIDYYKTIHFNAKAHSHFLVYSPANFEVLSWQITLAKLSFQSYNPTNPNRKTLPVWGRQNIASPRQEAFLTTFITTEGCGARGNSGDKSAKEEVKPSGNR